MVVHDQVVARAGEQLGQSDLVIVVRLYPQFATIMAVRKYRLIQFADVERLPEILRKAGANCPHEVAVHPIEVVHCVGC